MLLRARDSYRHLRGAASEILHVEFSRRFGADETGPPETYAQPAKEIWDQWLLYRGQELPGERDAELIDPAVVRIRYGEDSLVPICVMRVGRRYFVEADSRAGQWWMGELAGEHQIVVWGCYGSQEEAFRHH